jgi:hypothetical protein
VFLNEPANNFIEDPSSPSVDAGDPLDDYSLELSPNGSRINLGAYGNTRWAALSPVAGPPPPPSGGGGGGGGGGCGLLGLDAVLALALLGRLRRRPSRR